MRLKPLLPVPLPSPVLGQKSGRWYLGSVHVMDTSSYIMVQDTLVGQPFYVPSRHTYDRIALNVTGVESGKSVRLGIYKHDGQNVVPGALLLDAGVVSMNTEGSQELTISQTLSPGWHWLACLSDAIGTGRLVASGLVGGDPMLGYDDVDNTSFHRFVTRSFTYGTLPDPFGTVDSYALGSIPRVWLRA